VVSGFGILFREVLERVGSEEWEESGFWSSSVPEASSDEGDGEVHFGDDLSGSDAEGGRSSLGG
jgi:hypothetical protein